MKIDVDKMILAKIIIANNRYDRFDNHKELWDSFDIVEEELSKLGFSTEEALSLYCELLAFDNMDDIVSDIGNFIEYIERLI